MQYGFSRIIYCVLIVSSVYSQSQKDNATVTASIEFRKVIQEIGEFGMATTEKYSSLESQTKARIKRCVNRGMYHNSERLKTPDSSYFKIISRRPNFKIRRPVGLDGRKKYINSSALNEDENLVYNSLDQKMNYDYNADMDKIQQLYYDEFEPNNRKMEQLPQLLHEIEMLINKFENLSKRIKSYEGKHNQPFIPTPLALLSDDITENNELSKKNKNSEWSEWNKWSPCSVTCGQGVQMRSRFKLTRNIGADVVEVQEKNCVMPACPPFSIAKLISKVLPFR